jgi:carboxymethylenebutenolidase
MRGEFVIAISLIFLLFLSGCLAQSEKQDPETQFLTNIPVPGETATESVHGDRPRETTLSIEAEVIKEDLDYFGGARGFLAKPSAEGSYPGVVMIHEWWGLNDNIRNEAQRLAREGYVVLAVDLYNQKVAQNPDEARALVGAFDQEQAIKNMLAAKAYLQEKEMVTKIASLGWCFGGGQSLQLTLNSDDLDATVIYYGRLATDKDELKVIDWPVLGIFASEDQGIPVNIVREFEASLNDLGVENEIHIYEGADHAFANPSGDRYNMEAAEDAWEKTLSFLDKNLKKA